jgi:hypothetical protein
MYNIKEGVVEAHAKQFPINKSYELVDDSFMQDLREKKILTLNKNGFRCDDFLIQNDKNVVLTGGCSVTFGVGLLDNETWPKILNDLLDTKTTSVYNISKPGWSLFDIVYNIFIYLHNFQKPKAIFLLLPDLYRSYGYSFITNQTGVYVLNKKFKEDDLKNEIMMSNLRHALNYLTILEEYCSSNKIQLSYTSWESQDSIGTYLKSLENYIYNNSTDRDSHINEFSKNNQNMSSLIVARDHKHPGLAFQSYYANLFYSLYKEIK